MIRNFTSTREGVSVTPRGAPPLKGGLVVNRLPGKELGLWNLNLMMTLIWKKTLFAIRILNIYHVRQKISGLQDRKWGCEIVKLRKKLFSTVEYIK